MSPLGAVAAGLALVVLDLRVPGVDVLPDVLGWVLVVVGLARLPEPAALVRRTRAVALLCGVLSLADLSLPLRTTTRGDAAVGPVSTTTAVAPPEGLQAVLVSAYSLAFSLALVLLALALRARATQAGDHPAARTLGGFALFHAAVGVLGVVAEVVTRAAGATGERQVGGGAAALLLVAVLVALAVGVWFVLTLLRLRTRPWAVASAAGQVSPAGLA